ncbi:13778_t:CDS:1, partial [Funneliformis geosporum]
SLQDEITKYLNARYISAIEASWKLFNFGLQERSHTVERFSVHLENQHIVTFQEGEDLLKKLEKSSHTKLTCYFQICENNPFDPII